MDQENTNKTPKEKDLSNSFSHRLKNIMTKKGGYEKGVFILLIAIVVIGIPLSIWQINNQLESPFVRPVATSSSEGNSNASVSVDRELPVLENLRELDTDLDGLSDYDELYRYKTSPYIADSDSDKIADKLEVEQGTDPNCPEGTTCGRQVITEITNTEQADLEGMSVEQLRQIMIDAGAPEEQVNQISEDELLATYQEILAEEEVNTNSSTDILNPNLEEGNTNSELSLETIDYETLLSLDSAEIRQLLIEGGAPKESLDQIDDQTLKDIYLESLSQNYQELSQQQ